MNMRMIEKYHAKQRRNKALIFSLIVHGIAVIGITIWLLKPLIEIEKDHIAVDFVLPPERIPLPKKTIAEIKPNKTSATAAMQATAAKDLTGSASSLARIDNTPKLEPPPLSTDADLLPSPDPEFLLNADRSPEIQRGSGKLPDGPRPGAKGTGTGLSTAGTGKGGGGLGNLTQDSGTGEDAFGGVSDIVDNSGDGTGDEFGSHIDEENGIVRGHISLIRLKHDMSDWWQDPTAITSLTKWLQEHVKTISTDMDYEGGALPLTNKKIMEAPLIIMTGHDQAMSVSYQRLAERNSQGSGFSDAERAALRKYILDYNGMLFFDYCGNGGNEKSFARLVETELRTVFPEYPLTTLNIQHKIFQCYFELTQTPVGGSTFWGTNYKGGNKKWQHIKGISVPGRFGKDRLAVIFCPLDYLCSMETAEIDSRAPLAARRSSDVYRFMTNMFVYQMRQRLDSK